MLSCIRGFLQQVDVVKWINRRLFPSRMDLLAKWIKNAWSKFKRCLGSVFACCLCCRTGNGSDEVAREEGIRRSAERRLSRMQRIERKILASSKRKSEDFIIEDEKDIEVFFISRKKCLQHHATLHFIFS